MKRILFIVLLVLPMALNAQSFNVILGRPTDQSVTVNMLFDQQVDVYIEYGTQSGNYTNTTSTLSAMAGDPVELVLLGLSPEIRYFYRVRYKKTAASVYSASGEYKFITQRQKGSAFNFSVESDPHPYDKKGCHNLWDICLQNQLNSGADFMLDLGDTFGDDHNPFTITDNQVDSLQHDARGMISTVTHSLPFFFCIGNHEGESGYYLLQTPPSNLATYETISRKKYFPNPYPDNFYTGNTEVEGNGMGQPENYYVWTWGDALFVVVDGWRYYTASAKPRNWDWTIGKAQYDWFKQTLENSNAKYKFVFTHHVMGETRGGAGVASLCEWGGYDSKGNYTFAANRPGWAKPIQQLMEDNHVNVFFQGHDHLYAKEQVGSVVYQTVPMPSDSTYIIGVTDNGDAFPNAIKFTGSGHLDVRINSDSATVNYVASVLPKDETSNLHNGDIVYSYSVKSAVSAVNNAAKLDWSVYPNPSDGMVNINLPDVDLNSLWITLNDVHGRQIMRVNAKQYNSYGSHLFLNLKAQAAISSGIYILSLSAADNVFEKKVLIIK